MSFPQTYNRIFLSERPTEHITPTTFKTESLPFESLLSALEPGKVLVQVQWLSLDPAMRGWLKDTRSYLPPVQIGETMRAGGLGKVVKVGGGGALKEGDIVQGTFGWTEYAVVGEKDAKKINIPTGATELDFLGPLGMTGMTAYFGLLDVGQIKAGETLVVSGAAGATGSIVCQIGKIKGARVIAIAGAKDKCDWLEKELGVDKALNYKSPNFKTEFKEAVGYLDVYFDNVGGEILDLCLTRLKQGARIALCGAISAYNSPTPAGLHNYLTLIAQRAKIQGFIVLDYAKQFHVAAQEMAGWIAEGMLKRKFHVLEGLQAAPEGLGLLFTGGNTGKLVVNVGQGTSSNYS